MASSRLRRFNGVQQLLSTQQLCVPSIALDEFVMATLLDDGTVIQDDNVVGVTYRADAV